MKKTIIKIALACIGLSIISYIFAVLYIERDGFVLQAHGHAAAALAIFFTYSLGAGLMALMFYSNTHGHDAMVHNVLDTDDNADSKTDNNGD